MRSLLALAACSLLAIIPACTEKDTVIDDPQPTPVEKPSDEGDDPPAPKPPAKGLILLDLGEVEAGTETTFDVPEGALGFNISAEGAPDDFDVLHPFGIERITAPDGTVVHDNFTPDGGTVATSVAMFDAIASASVPQSENVPEKLAGKWKVRFGVQGSTKKPKLKAAVRIQSTGDGAFHGGQLDLVIHVPEGLQIAGREIDAANPGDDIDIKDRIDIFFGLTSEFLGIDKGNVSFKKEDASYRELDGDAELLAGFAVSKGEKDGTQALHVLLTNRIAREGQPFAAGLSAGIPGAATVFGRSVSGIILEPSDFGEHDAHNLLHEVGHFFGLNHTTEVSGGGADPLSDTPVCEGISRDPDVLYACPDRMNVMFAAGALEIPATLSPTQTRIYRGSPVYRALPAGSGDRTMSGRTMFLDAPSKRSAFKRMFRRSGSTMLSPVERELSLGFCGHTPLDANGLVKRHGRAAAIAQLRAAAADQDLAPYIRGRANLALKALDAQ